jgi:FkbM family methyltransferase
MLKKLRHYTNSFGPLSVVAGFVGKMRHKPVSITVRHSCAKHPFSIRVPSTDIPTFHQIFQLQQYECQYARAPLTLIDAGANIGLASIYFASLFPNLSIIAIEAEQSNFSLLTHNVKRFDNVTPVFCALWNRDIAIDVIDSGSGNWGFTTKEPGCHNSSTNSFVHTIPGRTICSIMQEYGIKRLDILKMDIEGAEREVFRGDLAWIHDTDAIIVELHEVKSPGAIASYMSLYQFFDYEWEVGENMVLAKEGTCLIPPSSAKRLCRTSAV